jgi:hypothetical protein
MSRKVFDELANSSKELLKDIIKIENEKGNIVEFLNSRIKQVGKENEVRGIIGTLKKEGLLKVSEASNYPYVAYLTDLGRTYFEREERYFERLEKQNGATYNVGTINANNSNVVVGEIINSTLNVELIMHKLDEKIDKNGGEDKKELKELLEEAKEIIDNIEQFKNIQTRKTFTQKLSVYLKKHDWFYKEILIIFGQTVIKSLTGE